MKQDKKLDFNKKASLKKKAPPIKKDPKVFERAFAERLDLHPADYILDQILALSDICMILCPQRLPERTIASA